MKWMCPLFLAVILLAGCRARTAPTNSKAPASKWVEISETELFTAVGNLNDDFRKTDQFPGAAEVTIVTNGITYKVQVQANRVKKMWKDRN